MFYFFAALLSLAAIYAFVLGLARADPRAIVRALRLLFPVILIVTTLLTAALGRPGPGVVLAVVAALAFFAARGKRRGPAKAEPLLRSPWLELEIEGRSGKMQGLVLAGAYEGRDLSAMKGEELLSLYASVADDAESRALVEAYLDSRMPGWRGHLKPDAGRGQGRAPGAGAMADEEAYQILGLQPGAGSADIRKAHRRLTQRMRGNDSAAPLLGRIDEARDILLARHD
jgi:hypothetical protein